MAHQTPVVPVALREGATIYVAVELSMSSWVIGLVDPRSGKISRHQIPCGAIERLMDLIERMRKACGCARVVLCFEAGRDGFWLYRALVQRGLEVLVLDPASLPVDRRHRRAKTDCLDVEMLLRGVMAHERGEIGSYSGLVPTPWRSGGIQREQGISKAGNARVRTNMIELTWLWLQWQPDSALSKWFHQRVGPLKGRMRKIMAVAMARKLLIALWKFVTTGEEPEGAILAA